MIFCNSCFDTWEAARQRYIKQIIRAGILLRWIDEEKDNSLLSFISSGDVNRIYGTRVAIKTYKIIADLGKIKIIVQFKF